MKPFRKILLVLLVLSGLFLGMGSVRAEEDEESLNQKAASQLIDSMPDFFRDVIELQKMSPHDKINYILTKSEERIKEKVADKFKDDMQERLKEYAKEAFRAKAFMNDAVPKIRQAYLMGESFDWGKIDTDLNSAVDTKMNAFGKALDAAKIGWGAYEAYTEGGGLSAFKSVSSEIYDALAEAYIPGWGYFKLGKEMVEILGRYVMDYATDTALEGMLNDMYGLKSNPQALAQWLINKTPADIKKDLEDKWNDGMGYGRLWEGQGTDKGDEAMMNRIQGVLVSLRGEILAKKKTEEQKQAALTEKINQYLQKAKDAEAKTKLLAQKARDEARTHLEKIREFRYKVTGINKEIAEQRIDNAEDAFELEAKDSTGAIPYQPLARSTILSALEAALVQMEESGSGGYDQTAFESAIANYYEIRKSVIDDAAKAISAAVAAANTAIEQIRASFAPQEAAASAQFSDCLYKHGIDKCQGAANSLNSLYDSESRACRPYYPALNGELGARLAKDVDILVAEESALRAEAAGRMVKRYEAIYSGIRDLQKELDEAVLVYYQETEIIRTEIAERLHDPNIWRASEESVPDYMLAGDNFYTLGDVSQELERLTEVRKNMLEDQNLAASIHVKEKKALADYILKVESIGKRFESLLPKNLLSKEKPQQGTWGVEEMLVLKPFYQNEIQIAELLTGTIQYPGVNIPKVGDLPLRDYEKIIAKNPLEVLPKHLAALNARISFLENLVDADEAALRISMLSNRIGIVRVIQESSARDMEQEKQYLAEAFNTRDGMSGQFMHADLTPGLKYLNDLKAAWNENGVLIQKLDKLRKVAGKQIRYQWDFQGQMYPLIDRWMMIPDKIKLAEQEYQKSQELSSERLGLADKYLAEWKAKLVAFEKGATPVMYRPKEIQKFIDFANNQVGLLTSWGKHPDVLKRLEAAQEFKNELTEKLENAEADAKKTEEDMRRRSAEWQRQYEAEQARLKKEEEAAKKAEEKAQLRSRMSYLSINDVRINSRSMSNASGEVVVDRSGLVNNSIQLTGRISFMDNIERLLISLDGGRTWQELPMSQRIDFSFVPIPDVVYIPTVKIRLTTGDELSYAFFPMIQGIVYKDIDYNEMVMEAIKAIAEAYERADLSAFSDRIARDYLGNKTTLEDGVRFDFDMFTGIKLTIYVNRMERRADQMIVETKWDKMQTPRKTGQEQRTSGSTVMVFKIEDGKMKIYNLRGNLIYATLSPEIAQASGLPAATVESIRTAETDRNPTQPGAGTTDDAGGVTSSSTSSTSNITTGTFAIVQKHAHAMGGAGWIQDYDFATNASYDLPAGTFGPEYDFRRREGWMEVKATNGIQDLGAVDINSVTSVPSGGYATSVAWAAGHTFAISLSDGTYALVQPTDDPAVVFAPTMTTHFEFRHQKNGSRNF